MTARLLIYCEGQTEEMFVERVLRNYLALAGVKVERPILAATTLSASCQRGGFANWDAIVADLGRLFDSDADPNLRFTTLLDIYRMPKKVFDLATLQHAPSTPAEVATVESAVEQSLGETRFKAYFQRHEFEALVLADGEAVRRVFHRERARVAQLISDVAGFATAEDINHGNSTHPAARLENAVPGYGALKASNALFVLAEADMAVVRGRCPRFNEWLAHWEQWGNSSLRTPHHG